jgi:hypothetical protein
VEVVGEGGIQEITMETTYVDEEVSIITGWKLLS